jgi:hypothetical protein
LAHITYTKILNELTQGIQIYAMGSAFFFFNACYQLQTSLQAKRTQWNLKYINTLFLSNRLAVWLAVPEKKNLSIYTMGKLNRMLTWAWTSSITWQHHSCHHNQHEGCQAYDACVSLAYRHGYGVLIVLFPSFPLLFRMFCQMCWP